MFNKRRASFVVVALRGGGAGGCWFGRRFGCRRFGRCRCGCVRRGFVFGGDRLVGSGRWFVCRIGCPDRRCGAGRCGRWRCGDDDGRWRCGVWRFGGEFDGLFGGFVRWFVGCRGGWFVFLNHRWGWFSGCEVGDPDGDDDERDEGHDRVFLLRAFFLRRLGRRGRSLFLVDGSGG